MLKGFDQQRAFLNTSVNVKVDVLNSTILNVLSNFIPHEFVVCDDKAPPGLNKKIRVLFQEKNAAFKKYWNNSSNGDLQGRSNINSFKPV